MKVVIFDNPDGTITVRNPVQNPLPGSPAARRESEPDDDYFERLVAGPNRKGGTRVTDIDHTQLPSGHENFKAAREWDGTDVVVNMAKARVIQEDKIDRKRRLKARELIERETMGENVTAEKAQLAAMNVGPEIAAAQTPAALNAVWPPGLDR